MQWSPDHVVSHTRLLNVLNRLAFVCPATGGLKAGSLLCSVCSSAEVSGLDVSYSVTVNPDTNEFVVEDHHSSMMRVFEPSGDHLKRVLEEMAHFTLGMNLTHVFSPEYKYKCCLLQGE